jgi:two-component system, NtrC family, response regulator GlrR
MGEPPMYTSTVPVEQPLRDHALVRRFRLRVVDGEDRKAIFSPQAERTVIGTHASADFVLRDQTVSRLHCELTLGTGGVRVRDLGSRNGTLIAGLSIADAQLASPATLELGHTRIKLDWPDDHLRIPLSTRDSFGGLSGTSRPMRVLYAQLERAAQSDATVLLLGETGTGKDLAAHALHDEGPRRDRPWVVVDCGAIAPGLLESELFGHEKGAFTGATRGHVGAFERAHGGTLFLDEIGELSPELQPKFLRALEARRITPVGANTPIDVDVRIIAATHRGLRAEVNSGRFRSDLYYRLAVLPIHLPSLRQRFDDLPVLVDDLLRQLGAARSPAAEQLCSPESLSRLADHPWPGNVRELRNYVERSVLFRTAVGLEERFVASEVPPVDTSVTIREGRERCVLAFERRYLEVLMREHHDNVAAAARTAGVDRVHMHRLLAKVGLR